jgi:hypothetical protein
MVPWTLYKGWVAYLLPCQLPCLDTTCGTCQLIPETPSRLTPSLTQSQEALNQAGVRLRMKDSPGAFRGEI